ncbi:MAG TPA: lysophospholipid acyltransferase family protein [Pyrinomonadaceae bacterium]|nr:lysophospholipid acyltransferase family protein [Pyrinomonadaceae bacterium]
MAEGIAQIYRFDTLEKYSFSDRLRIRLADLVFYAAISLIGRTIRWEISGQEELDALSTSGKAPIYCLWHDRIFGGTYFLRDRGIVVITSQSLDGEYIARFLKRFGFGTIRGSSSRGGVRALVEMIREMRRGTPMAFTVDGPRGPRYEAKSGAVILAKKTGNPMVPFSVECERYWKVGSWDRLQIPRPFTKAKFAVGSPIFVDLASGDADVESKRAELQRSLEELVEAGRVWADRSETD